MCCVVSLLCVLSLFLGIEALNSKPSLANRRMLSNTVRGPLRAPLRPTEVCATIQQAVSNASAVYYPSDPVYAQDIWHYMTSSAQDSVCTVEPGTVDDVSKIIRILGDSKVPFGVKGGGHASNQGFSSTPGILISMTRFNKVVYDPKVNTVEVSTGVIWDDVYTALEPYHVNVVGGHVSGVGAAGLTLGGGYSWLTNLHGLTVDTLVALELVLPNGTIIEITERMYPDLFFGLKGGFNNFGIVTRFTLRAFRQTEVWAGTIIYSGQEWNVLADAIVNFQATNTDPNANILPSLEVVTGGTQVAVVLVFYNKPAPPSGLFDRFLNIPSISKNVSTRTFSDFILSVPSHAEAGLRGAFMTVSFTNLSSNLVQTIISETKTWGAYNLRESGAFVSYSIEPLLPSITQHATLSAFPHHKYAFPLNIWFAWISPTADNYQLEGIKRTAEKIAAAAKAEGQDIDSLTLYPNDCLADTPLERMYGKNVKALNAIKKRYDPLNIMGHAGGFKF